MCITACLAPWSASKLRWNEFFARLHQNLHTHIFGNATFLDEPAAKVELDLAGRRKTDFDFL
jgi:hypothetical protein